MNTMRVRASKLTKKKLKNSALLSPKVVQGKTCGVFLYNFLSQQDKPKNHMALMNCMQKSLSNISRSIDAITADPSCPHLHTPVSRKIGFDLI